MLDVITKMGVSFPLFCRTSLGELYEKWRIRGEFRIKIPAWPVRIVRALLSLKLNSVALVRERTRRINKIGRIQIKTAMYRRPSYFAILRVTTIVYSHKNYYKSLCITVSVRRSYTVAPPLGARGEIHKKSHVPASVTQQLCFVTGRFFRSSNVYETSCIRRIIEQLKLIRYFASRFVSLFSLGFHLFL
jgi:hypothetical protein